MSISTPILCFIVPVCNKNGTISILLLSQMTVHDTSPLLWTARQRNPLGRNKSWGVDVSCILYAIISCSSIYRALTRIPVASVQHLVATWCDEWYRVHKFAELAAKLVFVFDGRDCGLKRLRRLQRATARTRWRQKAAEARIWQELDKANSNLVRVNGHVLHAFCEWARNKLKQGTYCLFGSPFEADAQLASLEDAGFIDGILSEDSDLFFYETTRNLYSGFNTRSTKKYRTIINRTTADPYFSKLSGHSLRALASFCGTDYLDHLKGVGT